MVNLYFSILGLYVTLGITAFTAEYRHAKCLHYAECRVFYCYADCHYTDCRKYISPLGLVITGNAKGGSITVPLTSRLTGLD